MVFHDYRNSTIAVVPISYRTMTVTAILLVVFVVLSASIVNAYSAARNVEKGE